MKPQEIGKRIVQNAQQGTLREYIEYLREMDMLRENIPELHLCITIPGGQHFHKQTVYEHLIDTLAVVANQPLALQLAALFHDIGKSVTIKKEETGLYTFHKHETKGACLAYTICTRLGLPKSVTEKVVCLVRHHMFRFETENLKEKTISKWLRKVGKENWEDLFLLRQADRKGNVARRHKPAITTAMEGLHNFITQYIEKNEAVFEEDLDIPRPQLKQAMKDKQEYHRMIGEIVGIVNAQPERNNREWLLDYIKRVYGISI